jgi:hypothetical protein
MRRIVGRELLERSEEPDVTPVEHEPAPMAGHAVDKL